MVLALLLLESVVAAAAVSLLLLLLTECVFLVRLLPARVCVRVSCVSVRYVNARLLTLYVCLLLFLFLLLSVFIINFVFV